MEPVIIAQVKEHLAKGELESALQLLNTYAEANMKGAKVQKVKNEILYLQGQIAEVKKAESRGLIAFEQAERNKNQIRLSLIGLTDAVSGQDSTHPVFSDDAPQRTESPAKADASNIYKYIVIGIAAIVLFVVIMSLIPSDSEDPASGDANTEMQEGGDMNIKMQKGGNANTEMQEGAAGDSPAQTCFFVVLQDVEVLSDANLEADVLGTLPEGAQCDILQSQTLAGAEGETYFYYISCNNLEGWVEHTEAIQLDASCN